MRTRKWRKSANKTRSASKSRRSTVKKPRLPLSILANSGINFSDETLPWREEHLQAAACIRLRQLGVMHAASLEGEYASPLRRSQLAALGRTAGEPDLRLYASLGRVVFVEMKTMDGRLSPAQRDRHRDLAALGHTVIVLRAATPAQAQDVVESICKTHRIV